MNNLLNNLYQWILLVHGAFLSSRIIIYIYKSSFSRDLPIPAVIDYVPQFPAMPSYGALYAAFHVLTVLQARTRARRSRHNYLLMNSLQRCGCRFVSASLASPTAGADADADN